MKHTPEARSLKMLVGLISQHTDTPWPDVIGLDIDGRKDADQAMDVAVRDDDAKKAAAACLRLEAIERDYLQDHRDDIYQVTWPDHIVCPQFDGDAKYRWVWRVQSGTDLEIKMLKRDVAHLVDMLSIAAHGLHSKGMEATARRAFAVVKRYRDEAGSDAAGNGDPGQDVDPEQFDTSVL